MKENIRKLKLDKVAHELAEKYGNESLDNPESVGFVRFMMYSCCFFHATGQCVRMKCENCKATAVIEKGVALHPELKKEYEVLKILTGKASRKLSENDRPLGSMSSADEKLSSCKKCNS